jgi:hypothetical protein
MATGSSERSRWASDRHAGLASASLDEPLPRYAASTHTQRGGVLAAWTTGRPSPSASLSGLSRSSSHQYRFQFQSQSQFPLAHQAGAHGQDKGPQSRPPRFREQRRHHPIGVSGVCCQRQFVTVRPSLFRHTHHSSVASASTPQNGIHSPRLAVGDSRPATLHVICRVATVARANDTAKGSARSVCWSLALGQT